MIDLNTTTNEEVLMALKEMLDTNQIDKGQFYKAVVGVSADYAKDGDILLAYVTLAIPPKEYFDYVQLKQMQEDPLYAEVAEGLAARLIRYGFGSDLRVQPTQKVADA